MDSLKYIYECCTMFSDKIDMVDDKGNTALSHAIQGNHGEVANFLLSKGASWKNLPAAFQGKVIEDAVKSLKNR